VNDPSNGWDAVAHEVIPNRAQSAVGVTTVREWAATLRPGTAILDLGCGSGAPIAEALVRDGFTIHGVDASPAMVTAFRRRCPDQPVVCQPVETSSFFDRTFDAAVSWGLLFLLPGDTQRDVIRRVARALNPGGRFLFTAPSQTGTWADLSTGRESISLGREEYVRAIADAGLTLLTTHVDEGENHYYDTRRDLTTA
jgi:cyclopropane fatty-acyl-phospholipid synthase-like methyltransferase